MRVCSTSSARMKIRGARPNTPPSWPGSSATTPAMTNCASPICTLSPTSASSSGSRPGST
jgi:hypothetical protein